MSKKKILSTNIDMLIDAIACHSLFSFKDGLSGYNQIKIDLSGVEKSSFGVPWEFYDIVVEAEDIRTI